MGGGAARRCAPQAGASRTAARPSVQQTEHGLSLTVAAGCRIPEQVQCMVYVLGHAIAVVVRHGQDVGRVCETGCAGA